jgi:hypothetical protein
MGVGSNGDTVTFTRTLAALKREGSNVLVTGDDAGDAHRAACENLFGERVVDRRRTVVSAGGVDASMRGHDPDDARRIEYRAATRGAAAATSDADTVPGVEHDLTSLGNAITDAIEEAERTVESLAPAQFRLCVDSLGPLLEAHDERAVFRFLHAVTGDVRVVDGMGHYHFSTAPDADAVRTLEPLFDAVVELRADAEPQQRWRLVDEDAETEWLPL